MSIISDELFVLVIKWRSGKGKGESIEDVSRPFNPTFSRFSMINVVYAWKFSALHFSSERL